MKTSTGLLFTGLTLLVSCKETPDAKAAPAEKSEEPTAKVETKASGTAAFESTKEWPMWGRDGTRNMVGNARDLPVDILPGELDDDTEAALLDESKNIHWAA